MGGCSVGVKGEAAKHSFDIKWDSGLLSPQSRADGVFSFRLVKWKTFQACVRGCYDTAQSSLTALPHIAQPSAL